MKKLLTALLCAALLAGCAFAEAPSAEGTPQPSPEASAAPEVRTADAGGMDASLNGESLRLEFDPDPMYSLCRDGYVQASFYVYGANNALYELYMTFPQDVQPGETLTPENVVLSGDIGTGLMLFVSDDDSDVCSAASQYMTGPYPEGSGYTLSFSEVTVGGTAYTFAGTIDANLVEVDQYYNATSTVNRLSGSFRFTMDLGSAASGAPGTRPTPEATQPPAGEQPKADEAPKAEPTAEPEPQRPPTPPAQLITPPNAQKI